MRISRYEQDGQIKYGFYFDNYLVEVGAAAHAYKTATGEAIDLSQASCILELLPP